MLHALVTSTLGFIGVRSLLGLGESGNYPGGIKAAGEWFPKKERALAIGALDSGSNVGAAVGPILVPFILGLYGWQMAFIITGSLGFIWLIFWRIFYDIPSKQNRLSKRELDHITRDNTEDGSDATDAGAHTGRIGWGKLFTLRQTWAFMVGKFLSDPIWFFFLFWLPSYFHSVFKLDLTKPSWPLIIVYSATMVGSFGGGYLSSWLIKKGWPVYRARKLALLVAALCVIPIILSRDATSLWMVVGLIALSVAANQAWSANIYSIVPDMFPNSAVSSVVGLGGMAGAVGSVLFPLFIGYILDYYKSAGNIESGYNIIFLICASSFLVAWIIIHFITPKMSKVVVVNHADAGGTARP